MRIVPGFVIREIVGENIAIPTGDAARRLSGMLTLNECGRFLFTLLQTEQTKESLVEALLTEYEVDWETASDDVDAFIARLEQSGFLE